MKSKSLAIAAGILIGRADDGKAFPREFALSFQRHVGGGNPPRELPPDTPISEKARDTALQQALVEIAPAQAAEKTGSEIV